MNDRQDALDGDYAQLQYAGQDNLKVRIETHKKYTLPQVDFVDWVLDRLEWRGDEWVIDVGAGDGQYGRAVKERCGFYLAADLYLGMLRDLDGEGLIRLNLDAAAVPLADDALDVILANHMLYYVEDKDPAYAGFSRVLRPGGRLLAATNSELYMGELRVMHSRIAAQFGYAGKLDRLREGRSFTLENGQRSLERHFQRVERFDLPSALVFSEAEPAVAYLASFGDRLFDLLPSGVLWQEVAGALEERIDAHIAEHGEFRVSKLAGVFVCQN
ncbi:MAG TPA: class I SAM-dependent methyltransferase [Anaerolineae bacterium]|jgi:SAM-dependent methyltransferase|nr:class I SAM-dependent methyltransferase [Anaerolineae bacterium]